MHWNEKQQRNVRSLQQMATAVNIVRRGFKRTPGMRESEYLEVLEALHDLETYLLSSPSKPVSLEPVVDRFNANVDWPWDETTQSYRHPSMIGRPI